MSQRLICECGNLLSSPAQFCPFCNRSNALGCGIYVSERKVHAIVIGKHGNEFLTLSRYNEDLSIRNLYEVLAEKVYERRVEEIVISGERDELLDEAFHFLRDFLYPFHISITDPFDDPQEFFRRYERAVRTRKRLVKVNTRPEDKIQGSHSTIVGGREGYILILQLAKSPYVKKVVPGVIEGNATTAGGGVRLKLTRCDERGNLRALLIDGATVQQIHVITTASSREEGEEILKILSADVRRLRR